ncbi:universal stress protein [Kitasatospora sp. NBC_01560]|uniref:universal stress protein n=1 Tax=Kitasatospora sp. NBC_01560 TaxID=2975965 RepID=UPI00386B4BA0
MGSTQDDTHTIVVGIDGSPSSSAALHWALEHARLDGSTVHAVTAWDYPPLTGWGLSVPGPEIEEAARLSLANAVQREESAESAAAPAVPVRQHTVYGHPAEVLLRAAHGARLLVVGSRGLGGFKGTLLGSVSRHCVEHSPCPVVVVRGTS